MTRTLTLLVAAATLALIPAAPTAAADSSDAFTPAAALRPFADDAELKAYFEPFVVERVRLEEEQRRWMEVRRAQEEEARKKWMAENPGKVWVQPPPPPVVSAPAPAAAPPSAAAESITNTQTAGVDEGGIVKVHGKHLVVLRRGRLFTVNVDRHDMKPIAALNAYGTDVNPAGAWYDEMLIAGNTIVVIGYSYARGGTEVGLFDINDEGQLAYKSTWHLRSNDYYSSRNYASRLIGNQLVFYTPVALYPSVDPFTRLPAVRNWGPDAANRPFENIADAKRIYHTGSPLEARSSVTLHTVVSCDLAQPQLACKSTSLLGPGGRVFYVSARAVYVWTSAQPLKREQAVQATVYRMPLDGGPPSALKAAGSPIDQFSFLEGEDGYLNVLLRAQGQGDGMWRGESVQYGNLALLRVPVREFGDGQATAAPVSYHALPEAKATHGCSLQNRFIGKHLLYGAGCNWGRSDGENKADLQVLRYAAARFSPKGVKVHAVSLNHGVDRLEAMGSGAVVVGSSGSNLIFSSVALDGTPRFISSYRQANASQGETRSHGFFYKPDGEAAGLVGLPIRGGGQPGYRQLWDEPAAMLYLRNDQLKLSPIGQLPAKPGMGRNDSCKASCVDWYGNARPVFLRNRVFALMGYELVEGRILKSQDGEQIVETRRVAFHAGSSDYGL